MSVPTGFGTRGGTFFVNDATVNFTAAGHIYDVPAGGGSFATFANTGNLQPIGGVFLPSNCGALGGQYLAAGNTLGAPGTSDVVAFSSTASQTSIGSGIGTSQFADTVLAPAGFDSAGGQIVLVNEGGTI